MIKNYLIKNEAGITLGQFQEEKDALDVRYRYQPTAKVVPGEKRQW